MKSCHVTLCSRMEHLEANERSLSLAEVACPFLEQVKLTRETAGVNKLHVRQAVLTPSFSRGALEAALQNWMWSSVIVTSMQR